MDFTPLASIRSAASMTLDHGRHGSQQLKLKKSEISVS
jgi:hypothetical protein